MTFHSELVLKREWVRELRVQKGLALRKELKRITAFMFNEPLACRMDYFNNAIAIFRKCVRGIRNHVIFKGIVRQMALKEFTRSPPVENFALHKLIFGKKENASSNGDSCY